MGYLDHDFATFFTDQELSFWLGFDQLGGAGVGVKRVKAIFEYFEDLESAWKAPFSEMLQVPGLTRDVAAKVVERRKTVEPMKLLERCRALSVEPYPYYRPGYPSGLREIFDPPLIVYKKGALDLDDLGQMISIVGTRHPTNYGQRLSKQFARELAGRGVTVVSGMAVGCDSLAHWGAIEAGGRTVAVLATGPDVCYPSSNKPLYQRLIEDPNCAVISEFFPETTAEPWRFPARNRIVSGMSQALLLVEGAEGSGALITAHLAFDQQRQVFAIPGRIDQRMSYAPNHMIHITRGLLIRKSEEIMEQMNWVSAPSGHDVPTVVELFGREREIFNMLSDEPVHFDVLCQKAEMQAGEMSATLTMLELAGIVERQAGDWYTRVDSADIVDL